LHALPNLGKQFRWDFLTAMKADRKSVLFTAFASNEILSVVLGLIVEAGLICRYGFRAHIATQNHTGTRCASFRAYTLSYAHCAG
jgi:hypothetical protein